jgi:hypothetical protein
MFWIWVRGGPSAVFAFVLVVVAFVVLFAVGSQFGSWGPPLLIVPFFGVGLFVLARLDPRNRGGRSQPPDSQ